MEVKGEARLWGDATKASRGKESGYHAGSHRRGWSSARGVTTDSSKTRIIILANICPDDVNGTDYKHSHTLTRTHTHSLILTREMDRLKWTEVREGWNSTDDRQTP